MLGDVSIGKRHSNDKFEVVEQERDGFLEEVSAYTMEKKNREQNLLRKSVPIKTMTGVLANLETAMNRL